MRARVYVAGPISQVADQEANANEAIDVAQQLVDLGYAPFVPQLSYWWNLRHANDWETWLQLDLAWVATTDAILALPGDSAGRDRETAFAEAYGIPVFWSVSDLFAGVKPQQPEPIRLPQED